MLFNSNVFIFGFLPFVVILYWILVRRSILLAIGFLALASYVFFVYGETVYPWMLAGSILFNYLCGLGIRNCKNGWSRFFMVAGVVGDLGWLGIFKYTNFFLDQVGRLVAIPPHAKIALPLGISFYTFTQIAYLVDTWREGDSESHLLRYTLFISYFPHLIAGPIIHHKEMMPQFLRPRRKLPQISIFAGICIFAIGLAKKVLLADPCGAIATGLFGPVGHGLRTGLLTSWVAALSYTAQIYFDFSGYSDMAIGISLMLGIRLPLNFNSPYKSRSVIEFWRRWHISLSRFLRDYLYFPLGGNRKGAARRYYNLLLTMVIGGLWHGAGWTFLIWGAIHGFVLFLNHLWRDLVGKRFSRLPGPRLSWLLTFVFVVFAWVPFRAESFKATASLWAGMIGLHGLMLPNIGGLRSFAPFLRLRLYPAFFGIRQLPVLVAALLLSFIAPNSQEILRRFHVGLDSPRYHAQPGGRRILEARLNWQTALIFGVLLAVAARSIGGYSEFIYFHF